MTYVFTDHDFFPSVEGANLSIMDEEHLSDDVLEFLLCKPTKMRQTGDWFWNAPENVKRHSDEPGYGMAYKDLGMGHWQVLYWNHAKSTWHICDMGGANGHDAASKYTKLVERGFRDDGRPRDIRDWFDEFSADTEE